METRLVKTLCTKLPSLAKLIRMPKSFFALTMIILVFVFSGFQTNNKTLNNNDIIRATLKNGLRVVIVRNALAPVVTTEINYLVGSNEAPKGFPGTAHALEHMMFRGSKELSADQLADITAAMGGDFDADTRQTLTQYYFTVPSEDLDVALHIESIRMKDILSTDSLWKNERGAIEQEVAQDLSNPQYVFYSKLLDALFKGTPYAHDALGTRPSFDKTTGEMLKNFHNSWYAPNNAILVIVGDIQPQKALDEVKDLFENIPSKKLPERPEVNLEPVKSDTLNLPTDLPYGLAVITFRMPGSDSPDYAAAQILSDVLSNQRGDLFSKLVPVGKALYAGFQYSDLPKAGLGFGLAVFPKGANSKTLIDEIQSILNDNIKKGFSEDLVEAEKRHELSNFEFQKNSVSGLASVWSEALAAEGKLSPQDDIDALEKVTVEDVNRVAKKYLDPSHAIYAILTPQSSGKPISQKGFGGQESFAPKNPKAVKLPVWADKALSRLTVPTSVVKPTVTVLSNGMKLIVQNENVSNTISVYGRIKSNSDLQTPKGQEGVASVLDQLFSYGSKTLDRISFQKALDDIGADEGAGTNFSLHVLSNHFEEGVKLLADNELNPGLPERAFNIIKQQTAATVAGELKSPDYLTGKALNTALYPPNDPVQRETTPGTVNSLSLKDVHDYYSKVYRPDLTTIVVIGNVTPEKAKDVIEKYFASWKGEGQKPETELSSVPENKPSTSSVPNKSRVQDKVILAETLGLNRSNPDYYALQLGNHVLGGAFYATRFYKDLRENAGLVYYVSSSFNVGKTRSTYEINYGCDPQNVTKAKSIIVRDLKQMRKNDVTSYELEQAKSMLMREIPLSESSLNSIALGLLSRSIDDLPLDEPFIAAKIFLKLSAKDVKNAFSKWVRPSGFVQVSEGPNPQ
ncbi:MAG: insulinase family protein [Bacteroidetes bacterium]|nr:insulinase family protein [Bacteroidota bacterium]